MIKELELPEDALNRLHHAINESHKSTEFIRVRRADLIALLYAAQKLVARQEP